MSLNDDITDTDRMDWLQARLFQDIDIRVRIDDEIKNSGLKVSDKELAKLAKGTL